MKIEQISNDVVRIALFPWDAVNSYVVKDILVDSGTSFTKQGLLSFLSGIRISGHVLTHAHFDHQGCSHAICEHFGVPLMCGEGDRLAVETGDLTHVLANRNSWLGKFMQRFAGQGHPVSRTLHNGDELGGFKMIETPGHTPGHLALWRETDRLLILGDVLFHRNPLTRKRGLTEPYRFATFDPAMNRKSARKLAELEPSVVCFGHGEPLRDAKKFLEFISTLSK